MLDELAQALQEIPDLLENFEVWQSEHKDQGGPEADRLHVSRPNFRICLHKFYETAQVAMHSHPWPFAAKILKGRYEMTLATGPTDGDVLSVVTLGPGDVYTMPTARAWHKVRPLDRCVWTVMVNGKRWSPSPSLIFPALPDKQVQKILDEFRELIRNN